MTKLSWDVVGERFYETGIDRGVIYLDDEDGVAWSGLTAVSESPTGGDARPFYLDGVKYLNVPSQEEYKANIQAFTYPDIFATCDGTVRVRSGLFITQQQRKSFGFSYRTRIGNDVNGSDHGYKIHIIYNALATPSQRSNKSLGESADPSDFSWDITTLAPPMPGYKRTAHVIIDSRYTNPLTMSDIENILYGTDIAPARIPTLDELIVIFDTDATLVITDNGDGTWTANGPDDIIQMLDATSFQITSASAVFIDADSYTISSL